MSNKSRSFPVYRTGVEQDFTETSPKHHREVTETWPRGDRLPTDTLSRLCDLMLMLCCVFGEMCDKFPHCPIFLPDMLVIVVALHNYNRLFDNKYKATVDKWLTNAKTKWRHRQTGLLASKLPGASRKMSYMQVSGTYAALNCSYLSLVDEAFAKEQHQLMRKAFWKETTIRGITVQVLHEYQNYDPKIQMKAGDAGIVFHGITGGGSAFALGSATLLGDWEMHRNLLQVAEMAGGTVEQERERHYRLAELFLVGEATALAMRTNIRC